MTPTITSSIVRLGANAESKVEYAGPNAVVRSTALASGIPLVERNIFVAPEGQRYIANLKITSNSIAEASASSAELDAVTRAQPQSLNAIVWPRTLLEPSDEAQLISVVNSLSTTETRSSEVVAAASNYARSSTLTAVPDYLLNDLA